MVLKINISEKEKAWRIQLESESLFGKKIGDTIQGSDISLNLEGYELEITGGSDTSGFPLAKNIEGVYLKKALLTKGFGMRDSTEGIRRRKTLRGNQISATTALLNLKVVKAGKKPLAEIFPEQNQPKAKKEEKPTEQPAPATA